jgi:dethiobiotin synthetase
MSSKTPRDPTETGPTRNRPRGVFITGNDTGVGKTFVACELAKKLVASGQRVGVYKPAASGCDMLEGGLVSEDALALWQAAGKPKTLHEVCPQCFVAPLAPNLAAQVEGKTVDAALLRAGAQPWLDDSDFTIIEGAGGYFSPISAEDLNADLAMDLGLPVLLVVANRLGAIHQTLATAHAINTYRNGIRLAAILLNDIQADGDPATDFNLRELKRLMADYPVIRIEFGSSAGIAETLQCLELPTTHF